MSKQTSCFLLATYALSSTTVNLTILRQIEAEGRLRVLRTVFLFSHEFCRIASVQAWDKATSLTSDCQVIP